MNASRLREILDFLLAKEEAFGIQNNLENLNNKLSELVSQPQNEDYQKQFSEMLEVLNSASTSVRTSTEPSQIDLLEEIGADKYFIHDFSADIRSSIRDNPLSPAVTQQKLNKFRGERGQYIEQITQLRNNLHSLHIEASSLQAGEAEIGFLLPRPLFNNRLDQLIKELRDVNRIVRAFSEAATGQVEEVEVRQISTSDPLFFFSVSAVTIAAIGKAVTWALNTWKQVEEIRRVRSETRRTEVLTEKEAADVFDKKITEKINEAVAVKAKELIKDDGSPGRAKEQRTDIQWALESLLAHIERGMIVEVRFVLPPKSAAVDGEQNTTTVPDEFQSLQAIAPQLVFPKMDGQPILKLPQPPSDPRNE